MTKYKKTTQIAIFVKTFLIDCNIMSEGFLNSANNKKKSESEYASISVSVMYSQSFLNGLLCPA